jgi:cell wall-associated NlpC family hydrolase
MTFRQTFRQSILVAAVAFGAVALPATALAQQARPAAFLAPLAAPAPQAAPAPRVAPATVGKDDLAAQAASALDLWSMYSATGDRAVLARFAGQRDAIAAAAADRLSLDASAMQAAWRAADSTHQLVLLTAFTQLGVPYRAYKRIPGVGFDCSALTSWAWEQSGVNIPRNSRMQIRFLRNVPRATAQAGDLVWYPGHVMLYLGSGDAILHAPNRGHNITLALLPQHKRLNVKFANPIG